MRSITISFLVIAIAFVSCEQMQEQQQKVTTKISGEIINPKGDIVAFSFNDDRITDTLDASNKFDSELKIDNPVEMVFKHGDEITHIYVRPGDSLNLSLDTEAFDETLKYSGVGAEINSYKAAMVLLRDSLMNLWSVHRLPEDSFTMVLDSIVRVPIGYLADFNIEDEDFIKYVRENAKWQQANHKLMYEGAHKSMLKLDSFTVSEGFYAFVDELDVNDSTKLQYPEFKNYVQTLLRDEAFELFKESGDETGYFKYYLKATNKKITDDRVKERLLYEFLSNSFIDIDDDTRATTIDLWKSLHPAEENIAKIKELADSWAKLGKGEPAPQFKYVNINGDSISLADFKGKIVYIDVWATWCKPCIAEHPDMERLQKQFEDKDVAFLAVSIDGSQEPWKKMVEKKNLGGIHLYAPGAWEATIMTKYMIKGIPRFILIDHVGNIVDVNAARPSGNIADEIDKLLQTNV